MYARPASGPGVPTWEGGSSEVRASKEENAQEATGRPTQPAAPQQPADLQGVENEPQHQHQHQDEHQHHSQTHSEDQQPQSLYQYYRHRQLQRQRQHGLQHEMPQHTQRPHQQPEAPQISSPSQTPSLRSTPTSDVPRPNTPGTLAPGRSADRLVRKQSRQRLRYGRSSHGKSQPLPTPTPATVEAPDVGSLQHLAEHEITCQPQQDQPSHLPEIPSEDYTRQWLSIPTLDVGEPIEIDEAYLEPPEDKRLLDVKRVRRQPSSHLRSTSTRPVDPRLEDMVATGEQCTVRSETRPTPTPTPMPAPTSTARSSLPPSTLTFTAEPAFIEPDPECAMPIPELEDGSASEIPADLLALAEGTMPLRYASGPGGVRKYTVGGVALRYCLSADAAMRCANVVRNRPRMRKRTKTRLGSGVSSAMTSPAMSSAPSPPMPVAHFPLE